MGNGAAKAVKFGPYGMYFYKPKKVHRPRSVVVVIAFQSCDSCPHEVPLSLVSWTLGLAKG